MSLLIFATILDGVSLGAKMPNQERNEISVMALGSRAVDALEPQQENTALT
jgi:hypothetical protein